MLRFSILDQECWAIQAPCCCTLLAKPSIENKRCSVRPPPGSISLWGEGGYHWTSATFVSRIFDKVKNQVTDQPCKFGLECAGLNFLPGVCLVSDQSRWHSPALALKQNQNFYNGLRFSQDADLETNFCRLGCQTEGNCHRLCKETEETDGDYLAGCCAVDKG